MVLQEGECVGACKEGWHLPEGSVVCQKDESSRWSRFNNKFLQPTLESKTVHIMTVMVAMVLGVVFFVGLVLACSVMFGKAMQFCLNKQD